MTASNFRKLKHPWLIAMGLSTLVIIFAYFRANAENLRVFAGDIMFNALLWDLNFLLELLVPLAFVGTHFFERKNGYDNYIFTRTGRKGYLLNLYGTSALLCFIMVFVPLFVMSIVDILTFTRDAQPIFVEEFGDFYQRYGLAALLKTHPMFFLFLCSVWSGIIGVMYMTTGFLFGLYVHNVYVVYLSPFFSYIAFALVFDAFGGYAMSNVRHISDVFDPQAHYWVTILAYLGFQLFIFLWGELRRRKRR